MNHNLSPSSQSASASQRQTSMMPLLDRLVCGELDEADRTALLAWLEEDLKRWRLCGLLFLEAQTWSEALRPTPTSVAPQLQPVELAQPRLSTNRPAWRTRTVLAAIAASLVVAFTLGFMSERLVCSGASANRSLAASDAGATANGDSSKPLNAPLLATLPIRSTSGAIGQAGLQIPVVASTNATSQSATGEAIPEYVQKQWERRGLKLSVERRYLFAKLPDGGQVAVPVQQYSLNRVRPRIN